MSGASDLVSNAEVSIPCLHVPLLPTGPAAHAAAALVADSDDGVPILRFTHCPALVLCDGDKSS
jgi:hypothetical protein